MTSLSTTHPPRPAVSRALPRLCFVGPMVGRNRGRVTTQGEILSDLLAAEGYPVISVSALPNRYLRPADIAGTLIRRRREIDLQCLQVYGKQSFLIADFASWLGRRLGQRLVLHLHGGSLPAMMRRFPTWTRRVLGRADALVAPSEFLARAATQHGHPAQIIPNVIDLADYAYRHRSHPRPHLFWMRSFHPIYNPEMAIRVLAHLRATTPGVTLAMAGPDKGTEATVRQLAAELGVSDDVRFVGFLDMAGKAREGERAGIFLNTNRIDNMPVSIVEACAMGLPVVATAVGGVPDLLTDGETGLLVPDDDDQAMAAAVRRLLAESDLAGRLSGQGRGLAERSASEQICPQWKRLFAEVMTSRSDSHGTH